MVITTFKKRAEEPVSASTSSSVSATTSASNSTTNTPNSNTPNISPRKRSDSNSDFSVFPEFDDYAEAPPQNSDEKSPTIIPRTTSKRKHSNSTRNLLKTSHESAEAKSATISTMPTSKSQYFEPASSSGGSNPKPKVPKLVRSLSKKKDPEESTEKEKKSKKKSSIPVSQSVPIFDTYAMRNSSSPPTSPTTPHLLGTKKEKAKDKPTPRKGSNSDMDFSEFLRAECSSDEEEALSSRGGTSPPKKGIALSSSSAKKSRGFEIRLGKRTSESRKGIPPENSPGRSPKESSREIDADISSSPSNLSARGGISRKLTHRELLSESTGKTVFSVHLGGGDKKSVLFVPTMPLSNVVEKICMARGVSSEDYSAVDFHRNIIPLTTKLEDVPNAEILYTRNITLPTLHDHVLVWLGAQDRQCTVCDTVGQNSMFMCLECLKELIQQQGDTDSTDKSSTERSYDENVKAFFLCVNCCEKKIGKKLDLEPAEDPLNFVERIGFGIPTPRQGKKSKFGNKPEGLNRNDSFGKRKLKKTTAKAETTTDSEQGEEVDDENKNNKQEDSKPPSSPPTPHHTNNTNVLPSGLSNSSVPSPLLLISTTGDLLNCPLLRSLDLSQIIFTKNTHQIWTLAGAPIAHIMALILETTKYSNALDALLMTFKKVLSNEQFLDEILVC